MKKILLLLLFLNSTLILGQEWNLDYQAAKTQAQNESKPIVLVFQGSDWCAPCIKLEKTIWSSPEFIQYAKEHYIMLKADFPRKGSNAISPEQRAANEALAKRFNPRGHFPFVVILDGQDQVLGVSGYKKISPKEYIQIIDGFVKKP